MFTLFNIDLGCEHDLERDFGLLPCDLDPFDRDRVLEYDRECDLEFLLTILILLIVIMNLISNVIPTLCLLFWLLSLFLLLLCSFPFLDISVLVRLMMIF